MTGISDRTAPSEAAVMAAHRLEPLGALTGGVAHDFNNVLAAILGHLELARDDIDVSSPARIHLEQALAAVDHGAAMTKRLLSFSRCAEPQPRELDVNEIVLDVGAMLRRLIGGEIRLETELDPLHPRITADANQLRRVLVNLAVNARDAMTHGGVLTISTRYERTLELVEISVHDTGFGIDAAVLERAFEPFFTTKPAGDGTGLGLAIVHEIVTQFGGSIEVDSAPGRGTTFSIGLPAAARSWDDEATNRVLL